MRLTNAALAALLFAVVAARGARAEPVAAAVEPRAETAPARAGPVRLRLKLGARELDAEAVRVAVARELGASVVTVDEGPAALEVEVEGKNRVTVRYTRSESEALTRSVDLPQDPARAVEVIALLSGNLVRNEASELAEALRRRDEASEPASAEPSAAPAEPPALRAPAPELPAAAEKPRKAQRKHSKREDAGRSRLLRGLPLNANLSLYHPISTFPDSEQRLFNLELGLAYSHIGAIEGVAWQLGVLDIDRHSRGWAAALLWTRTRGPVRGLTTSVFLNQGSARVEGAALAGFVALHHSVEGAELAGIVASAGHVEGVQSGGIVSNATSLRGAQLSGVVGFVRGDTEGVASAVGATFANRVEGALLSGAFNVASDIEGAAVAAGMNFARDVDGVELASINVGRDVAGLQLGIVNVGRNIDGVQLGIVNVASEVRGASLGLVSVAGNGRVQPMFWSSTSMPLHASVKFQTGYVYSELGGAYNPELERYAFEAGLGAHVPLSTRLSLEPGVHYSDVQDTANPEDDLQHALHYRARAALRLTRTFEVFAGGGVRHGIAGEGANDVDPELLGGLALF